MEKYVDLHTHTNYSDGTMSPKELIKHAYENRLSAVAVTDHDTIKGVSDAKNEGEKLGVEVISGIELSTEYKSEIHMLGYMIDENSEILTKELEKLLETRIDKVNKMIKNLNNIGIYITTEDIKEEAEGASPGRVHISRALINRGYVKSIDEAFEKYLGEGKPGYAPRERLSPEDGIKMITEAGGIPVIAHPGLIQMEKEELELLIKQLSEKGLKGIEAYYPSHNKEQTEYFLHLASKYNLTATGGSDFHGENSPNIRIGVGKGDLRISYNIVEKLKLIRSNG